MTEGALPSSADVAEPSADVVALRDVIREYPASPPVRALGPVSFTIAAGEHVSVMGPSGSGKSTLLNLVGLLDRPSAGDYRFDGLDTAALGERERTSLRGTRIGFVFQSFHLLRRRSAVENVAIALLYSGVSPAEREERAREVLRRVGLAHRADAEARTLSGGEQQRVAIARAVLARPALLLCDEPTGALDQATGAAVLDLLDGLHAEGMTLAVITHDEAVARRAQRTLRLRDGLVEEDA